MKIWHDLFTRLTLGTSWPLWPLMQSEISCERCVIGETGYVRVDLPVLILFRCTVYTNLNQGFSF